MSVCVLTDQERQLEVGQVLERNPPPWAALSGGRQTVMLCA